MHFKAVKTHKRAAFFFSIMYYLTYHFSEIFMKDKFTNPFEANHGKKRRVNKF